jgi:hypothetical protein
MRDGNTKRKTWHVDQLRTKIERLTDDNQADEIDVIQSCYTSAKQFTH